MAAAVQFDITPRDVANIASLVESEVGKGADASHVVGITHSVMSRTALGTQYNLGPQYGGSIEGTINAYAAYSAINSATSSVSSIAQYQRKNGPPSSETLQAVAGVLADIARTGRVIAMPDF